MAIDSILTARCDVTALRLSSEGPRLPALPTIGLDEHTYAHAARDAERDGDRHAKEAAKVGLYVTAAMDPHKPWQEKLRNFTHALNRHCHPPPLPDDRVWGFYGDLAHLVKEYCGAEALRLASKEDDFYAARLAMGQPRDAIENEAELFFDQLIGRGDHCPPYMLEDAYETIRMIRDQWI
jgi:hypothetical protein